MHAIFADKWFTGWSVVFLSYCKANNDNRLFWQGWTFCRQPSNREIHEIISLKICAYTVQYMNYFVRQYTKVMANSSHRGNGASFTSTCIIKAHSVSMGTIKGQNSSVHFLIYTLLEIAVTNIQQVQNSKLWHALNLYIIILYPL